MYRYFFHSQKYSFLSVTLTCILGWLQHRLNDGENCRNSNISVLQGYSAISHNFQTSGKHKETQSNLSCYSIQVKSCLHQNNSNLFFIHPPAKLHFPVPRGQLSSLHLMSTLPHFSYFPNDNNLIIIYLLI